MSDKMWEALETLKASLRVDDPHGHYDLVCEALAQAEQRGEVVADTGNAEADRIINRLMSADPDFDDCEDAAKLIRRLAATPAPVVPDDVALFDALMNNCWKIEPFNVSTGGDDYSVGWRVVEFHMPEREVEIARTYSGDPREAIREANRLMIRRSVRAAMPAAAPTVATKGVPDDRPLCYSCGCRSEVERNWMGRSICSKCRAAAAPGVPRG